MSHIWTSRNAHSTTRRRSLATSSPSPAIRLVTEILEKSSFAKSKSEYEDIKKANSIVNHEKPTNVSVIDIFLPKSKVFICQIPQRGLEDFWKTVFSQQITNMVMILDSEPIECFPTAFDGYMTHGSMTTNNRRVEDLGDGVRRFKVEVIPDGCSNAVLCTITTIENWPPGGFDGKPAVIIKEINEFISFLTKAKDQNGLVMSGKGVGRAGYFITLATILYKFDTTAEPQIPLIVKSLRAQMPSLMESLIQYVSLYTTLFFYTKIKNCRNGGAAGCDESTCRKADKAIETFTKALQAELDSGAKQVPSKVK
ncbi:hypothetical protein B9Z55_002992 [Caenorhabditis nigoni]|uniref:Tyrosine-protein phosphatase domain-containing protein n=1 Tax=Caenorhabditis nigoni TaxID=1611254 RepID=A0A2G5VMY5_9PELO|nr:hypothetical protein B9Z55_002992 [Caenorhabditis nigoni]